MLSKIKLLALTGLTAVAVGVPATAALASPAPTPSDTQTVSPHFGVHPSPRPVVVAKPYQFDIQLSHIDGINVNRLVSGSPFATNAGSDVTLTNTRDRFTRPGGALTVNHTGLGAAAVNTTTCTVTYSQTGVWALNGPGTGNASNILSGHGSFRLIGLLSVPDNARGLCPLTGLSIPRAVAYANGHANFSDFAVQGTGTLNVRTVPLTRYVH
jgi:hypothetical protein